MYLFSRGNHLSKNICNIKIKETRMMRHARKNQLDRRQHQNLLILIRSYFKSSQKWRLVWMTDEKERKKKKKFTKTDTVTSWQSHFWKQNKTLLLLKFLLKERTPCWSFSLEIQEEKLNRYNILGYAKYYDVLLLIPTRNSTVWNSREKLQMTQEMGKIMQNTTLLEFFPPPQNLELSASATEAYS